MLVCLYDSQFQYITFALTCTMGLQTIVFPVLNRRVSLCRLLLASHDLLLLDEPTNRKITSFQAFLSTVKVLSLIFRLIPLSFFSMTSLRRDIIDLDAESISWLEQFLAQFKGTVVCITHDR